EPVDVDVGVALVARDGPVRLHLGADVEGQHVLVTEVAAVAPEPGLGIQERDPQLSGPERAGRDVSVVEHASEVRELTPRDVAPDDGTVVSTERTLVRRGVEGGAR